MKPYLLIPVFLLATACNKPDSTVAAPVVQPTENQAIGESVTPPEPCPEPTGYQVLPAGLAFSVPYHLRADRVYEDKNGQERRRVHLEYLVGDMDSTLAAVDEMLLGAGYAVRTPSEQPNGNRVIPYAKKGAGNIIVIANPLVGDKPGHPAAKGVVALDYPTGTKLPEPTATSP